MHVAEQPNGHFYRPASIGLASYIRGIPKYRDGDVSAERTIPDSVREAIWNFLRHRASFLMAAPGLDMNTYRDHPTESELSDDEHPEEVAVNTHSNEYGWPPRWGSIERRFGGQGDVQAQAFSLLNQWCNDLKKNREVLRPVIEEIGKVLDRYYFGADLHVALRVRQPKNEYGVCTEEIEYRKLRGDAPPDLAEFAATAHNSMIEILSWMDRDLPQRKEDAEARWAASKQQRDLNEQAKALFVREKRHAAAVKKVKARLAEEKAEAQSLMDAANRRMEEAMAMVKMAKILEERK